ncbi:MAG: extracellular solute-binding protein [Clostridia bacterium]|nr:extracellular solute-binding protein [Clostridia bacterium]
MKKTLSFLLALVMVLSLASMAGAGLADSTEYKGEIKYLTTYFATDPNEEPPAKVIEELTGYKVTYYMLPSEGADEKLNLELSSGAEYDIMRISTTQFRTLAPKGALVDIAPYLENTTYLKDIMNDLEWSAAAIGDKIYGIPQFDAYYVSGGVVYNTRLFEDAGFKLDDENPDRQLTLNEFVDILRNVKATNPDVIPYTGRSAVEPTFSSAFGIVTHDWQPDVDGSIVYRFLHSNMKDYIACMHSLYEEGLLDVEWPVNMGETVDQKFTTAQAASFNHGWVITGQVNALAEATGDTVDYLWPLSNDEGLTRFASNKGVTAFGCIPVTSKNVEAAIDFLDLRAEPETFLHSFIGYENEQWEYRDTDGDGELEYWPILDREPGFTPWNNGHYFNIVNSPASFTSMWLARARKGAVQYEATVKQNGYPQENWVDSALCYAPPMEAISKYTQALNTFTNDYILECIAGTRSVEEYDAVVDEFLAEGGQDMIDEVAEYLRENADLLNISVESIKDSNIYK